MPSITLSDSRRLSYAIDEEPKNGPLILLANPLCASLAIWDHVTRELNSKGFRTLRFDQPGHGGSSAPEALNTTFPSMADDVAALLRELGVTKLHAWVGVSMGAALGFYFVAAHPGVVRKFVICDTITSSPVNAGVEDAFGARIQAARSHGGIDKTIGETLERWFGAAFLEEHPDEAGRLRELMLRTSLDGFESCCHALRSKTFDLRPLFGTVGAGVDEALCVVGEKDANLPESMAVMRGAVEEGFKAAGKPNRVDLVTIRNAGHVCFIDGFDQFVQEVMPWLTT